MQWYTFAITQVVVAILGLTIGCLIFPSSFFIPWIFAFSSWYIYVAIVWKIDFGTWNPWSNKWR